MSRKIIKVLTLRKTVYNRKIERLLLKRFLKYFITIKKFKHRPGQRYNKQNYFDPTDGPPEQPMFTN